jgi:pseudouridine-5'-phosphate glycosidase
MGLHRIRFGAHTIEAHTTGGPLVALETASVLHTLPYPDNLRFALQLEQTVREAGAVPAMIGVLDGKIVVGLDEEELTRLANSGKRKQLSIRDLAVAAAGGADGTVVVAAAAVIAAKAGIHVLSTGGLGGVHRDASVTFDESADLLALATTPIAVVCAGVKSVLNVGATLERLETFQVSVIGYRTRRFPGFFLSDSGFDLDWSADSPAEVADVLRARAEHGLTRAGVVVGNPLPESEQLDRELHDRAVTEALAGLARERVTGKEVTPYLLAHIRAVTGGQSLAAEVRAGLRNAELAGEIAFAALWPTR